VRQKCLEKYFIAQTLAGIAFWKLEKLFQELFYNKMLTECVEGAELGSASLQKLLGRVRNVFKTSIENS